MTEASDSQGLVPKLRFPEFRDDGEWFATPLRQLCTTISEKVGNAKLTPVSITAGKGFVSQASKFGRDISGEQYRNYTYLRRGDFAYNKGNSTAFPQGYVCQLAEFDEAAASSAFLCFQLHGEHHPRFVQALFDQNVHGRQLASFITSGARSNGLLNIRSDDFYRVKLPLPSDGKEQQKIADCLLSLDALISAKTDKLAALRDHKKGLMQQIFPAKGETTPRLRFVSDGGWTVESLPEVAFFQEGPGIMAVDFCDKGVPLVRLSGVSGPSVTLDGCNYLDRAKVSQKWAHFRLEPKDLVISTSATFGLVSTVTDVAAGAVFYTGLIRFRPHDERLHGGYLKAFLGSEPFARQVEAAAVGGGIKHFGPTHLKQMEIPIPPMAEQMLIAECLTSCDEVIDAQMRRLDAIFAHKAGLMQQLFPLPTGTAA